MGVDDTPANFNWKCQAFVDGTTIGTVGDAITADGVGECFWTTGTNDTGREIILQTLWQTAAGYSAQATAPNVNRVTLHAEALEEDADKIVCTVKLDKDTKQKTEIIDRHLNTAALKLKNPITGKKVHVVLYRRRYYYAKQRGDDPAIAACELRFRRSDTS